MLFIFNMLAQIPQLDKVRRSKKNPGLQRKKNHLYSEDIQSSMQKIHKNRLLLPGSWQHHNTESHKPMTFMHFIQLHPVAISITQKHKVLSDCISQSLIGEKDRDSAYVLQWRFTRLAYVIRAWESHRS